MTSDHSARERVAWLYNMERQATFTLNTHYLEDYRHKFEALFRSHRLWHSGVGEFVRRLTLSQIEEPPES